MTLQEDACRLLDLIAGKPRMEDGTAAEARELFDKSRHVLQLPGRKVASVSDLCVPSGSATLSARLYRGARAPERNAILIIFFHGGGWVAGNLESHDAICRRFADSGRCCVLSVDYRLAPEHRFPAAFDDALASVQWAGNVAPQYGVDPRRLVVAGDSAGGNLAAAVCLAARDRGGPPIAFQMLFYPATDLSSEWQDPKFSEALPLTNRSIHWFRDQYLEPVEYEDLRASPLLANLHGVPDAFILTAEYDPLRAEGIAYAKKLASAGVNVTWKDCPGQIHGFLTMDAIISQAGPEIDGACDIMLAAVLGPGGSTAN